MDIYYSLNIEKTKIDEFGILSYEQDDTETFEVNAPMHILREKAFEFANIRKQELANDSEIVCFTVNVELIVSPVDEDSIDDCEILSLTNFQEEDVLKNLFREITLYKELGHELSDNMLADYQKLLAKKHK